MKLINQIHAAGKQLGGEDGTIKGIPGAYEPDLADKGASTLEQIFSNVVGVFTIVAGLLFIIYFILGGLNWITAGGKPDKVEKAKKMMTDAAIGMIAVTASYAVIFILGQILGINILQPGEYINNL
jgi:cytochrome bd-type quinol oxidase subunit 2